eukprot:706618_1
MSLQKRKYIPPHLRNKNVSSRTSRFQTLSGNMNPKTRVYGYYNDKVHTRSAPGSPPYHANTQRKYIRYAKYQQEETPRSNQRNRPIQRQTQGQRVGSKRFCRDTPTPRFAQHIRVTRNEISGPFPDARGNATVVFATNSNRIPAQRRLLRSALEFVNLNPLPSPEKIKRSYGDRRGAQGSTAHIEYGSRMSYHSIFRDVIKKQSNNPAQTQMLSETFKSDHLNESNDLKPIQCLVQYMAQHQIVFDEELDCIRVNVHHTSTPSASTCNDEALINVKGVMNAFETIHEFVKFIQSHFESNQRSLLSFMTSSKSSKTELQQLLQDTNSSTWKGITGYMISYLVSKQCVTLWSWSLPVILRLLLAKNVGSYFRKRRAVEEAKKKQLIQCMESTIGYSRFHHLLSIVDAKASPIPSPPTQKAVSVRYIRYAENIVQFIYSDGSFMEYNFSGKHPKSIRFINIGLAHDEYLIGVLISHKHCLFMTNHHIMNGSGFLSERWDLFQVERKQHIIGLKISKTHGTLYEAAVGVIPSAYHVQKFKDVTEPCTNEGKCDEEEEEEGDDLVKFPAIFRFMNWNKLLMPSNRKSTKSDNEFTVDDEADTTTSDGIHTSTCMLRGGADDQVLDTINKHRFFYIACNARRSVEQKVHVFSFPSTFYRISKDFNEIEATIDVNVQTDLDKMSKSWLVPQ